MAKEGINDLSLFWVSKGAKIINKDQVIIRKIIYIDPTSIYIHCFVLFFNHSAMNIKRPLLMAMVAFCFFIESNSFAQMSRVTDICAGICNADMAHPILFNGLIHFQANSASTGVELFQYDGQNAPSLLLDINPGVGNSNPADFLIYNSKLYFSADDGTHGRQLWVYDGIASPTMVFDFGTNFTNFKVLQDVLYVLANNRVWSYNETGNPSSVANLSTFSITGGTILGATATNIYFTASTAFSGNEVWRYTGSGIPSAMDINPGTGSSVISNTAIAVGTNFYFFANDGTHGDELWVHTGTGSPSMVYDINPAGNGAGGIGGIALLNGSIYFQGNDGTHGSEVWKYDGINTPSMLRDINPEANNASPGWFTVIDDVMYFNATDATHGSELWKYNGTNNPVMVEDVVDGSGSFNPEWIFEFDDKIYMRGDGDDGAGVEVWLYDPSLIVDEDPPVVTFSPADNSSGVDINTVLSLSFNEAVRLLNHDALDNDNVDDLVELKLNDASGMSVDFDAVVNNNEIIITPLTSLLEGQVYYWALKANVIEDVYDNVMTNVESAFFTTAFATGIHMAKDDVHAIIFPNPVKSGMSFQIDTDKKIESYRIRNALGIQIHEGSTLTTIDEPGLYYIELLSEGKRWIRKVLVQ